MDTLIQKAFSGRFEIFNSSKGTIKPGSIWRDQIQEHLENASVVLVIITPRSIGREWVFFEAGATWFASEAKKKTMIPCVFPNDLAIPSTLSDLHYTKLADREDLIKMLTGTLQPISGLEPNLDLVESCAKDFEGMLDALPKSAPVAEANDMIPFLEQVKQHFRGNPQEFNNILRIALFNHLIT